MDYPLVGVRPSFTVFPGACAVASRRTAPLLGFVAPTAHEEKRVHVHLAVAPPVARQVADGSQAADFGVALRFFQPLGDFLPLSAVLPFSGR